VRENGRSYRLGSHQAALGLAHALVGHLVAILADAFSLTAFGLLDDPSVLVENVTLARVGAGALSLALTGAVLLPLDASHPPSDVTRS
jgi:predicted short-subunit dehydrogenase-like oxidoreductase (DUF2520 family)